MSREETLLAWLGARLPAIGDDCAVVEAPTTDALLLCSDAAVAGIHADLELVGMGDFGWKALVACLSDIAAMGGQPRWALVTISGELGPADFGLLYDGLLEAAAEYGCEVVGGDVTGGEALVVSVALVGSAQVPVRRSGARPGQTLYSTGALGGAAAGLRALRQGLVEGLEASVRAQRRPRARIAEGRCAARAGATAMIDVSDGLGLDLHRLADASGVGIHLTHLPVLAEIAAVVDDPDAAALGGGEDYELVFTADDPSAVEREFDAAGLARPVVIGVVTSAEEGCRWRDGELPRSGWRHR